MRILEIMSKPVITCRPTDTLSRAAELMWTNDVGTVAVVDDAGKLLSMVTDRDLCMSAFTQSKALHELPVSAAMSKQLFSCRPDDSLNAAEQLMRLKKVRRLPVIDVQGKPIGMVSMNDLTRFASSSRKSAVEHEVLEVLASIGEHRASSPSISSGR